MRPGSFQQDVIALYYAQLCAIPISREEGYNYVTSEENMRCYWFNNKHCEYQPNINKKESNSRMMR